MPNEAEMKQFLAEFEGLKAKYGEAFAELKVARLTRHVRPEGLTIQGWQDYQPYWCRAEDDGTFIDIVCEDVRQ